MTIIYDWSQIKDDYGEGLILGNGASMAFDERFSYPSLYAHAQGEQLIEQEVQAIFDSLNTTDFELILRLLWHAQVVNEALNVEDSKTQVAYANLRNALISTVRSVHASYDTVKNQLPQAADFMARFKTVLSLNYDLLIYWALLVGNQDRPNHFKDCFINCKFKHDWKPLRQPWGPAREATLVFYPHGSLAIASDIQGVEEKISVQSFNTLLETVIQKWEDGHKAPIFVSEGTSNQKVCSIQRSSYLNTVYQEVLPDLGNSVVIFGWSMSDQDDHILKAICRGNSSKFAVSTRRNSHDGEETRARTIRKLRDHLGENHFELQFFDANSSGCWVTP